MSKYLVSTTEIYRVDSEHEVDEIVEKAKAQSTAKPPKHSAEYKERKQKGEVIDSWWKLSITKQFTDEKEPEFRTQISYTNDIESAF